MSEAKETESLILRQVRAAINSSGRARVVRNSVGFDGVKMVRYGMGIGSPDLLGVLRDGRAFGVEVKAKNGRVSTEQAAWWMAARRWGVTGGVARSADEAMALLDAAEAGR